MNICLLLNGSVLVWISPVWWSVFLRINYIKVTEAMKTKSFVFGMKFADSPKGLGMFFLANFFERRPCRCAATRGTKLHSEAKHSRWRHLNGSYLTSDIATLISLQQSFENLGATISVNLWRWLIQRWMWDTKQSRHWNTFFQWRCLFGENLTSYV